MSKELRQEADERVARLREIARVQDENHWTVAGIARHDAHLIERLTNQNEGLENRIRVAEANNKRQAEMLDEQRQTIYRLQEDLADKTMGVEKREVEIEVKWCARFENLLETIRDEIDDVFGDRDGERIAKTMKEMPW